MRKEEEKKKNSEKGLSHYWSLLFGEGRPKVPIHDPTAGKPRQDISTIFFLVLL
jgi:hypothetical protein